MHQIYRSPDAPRVRYAVPGTAQYSAGIPELAATSDEAVIRRLVADMITLNSEGGATEAMLLALGYTRDQLDRLGPIARARANRRFDRVIETPAYDRAARLALAVETVRHLPPDGEAWCTALREAGFSTREINDLWDDLKREAVAGVAALACPEVA